ncbi:hypothetical protein GBF38_005290, partial [Nibea albiflora]
DGRTRTIYLVRIRSVPRDQNANPQTPDAIAHMLKVKGYGATSEVNRQAVRYATDTAATSRYSL